MNDIRGARDIKKEGMDSRGVGLKIFWPVAIYRKLIHQYGKNSKINGNYSGGKKKENLG